jgi:hypothetical protein
VFLTKIKNILLKKLKLKFLIPKGNYCYTWIEVPSNKNSYKGKVKNCPYFEYNNKNNIICHYLNLHDSEDNFSTLLFDQVKECSVNTELEEKYYGDSTCS